MSTPSVDRVLLRAYLVALMVAALLVPVLLRANIATPVEPGDRVGEPAAALTGGGRARATGRGPASAGARRAGRGRSGLPAAERRFGAHAGDGLRGRRPGQRRTADAGWAPRSGGGEPRRHPPPVAVAGTADQAGYRAGRAAGVRGGTRRRRGNAALPAAAGGGYADGGGALPRPRHGALQRFARGQLAARLRHGPGAAVGGLRRGGPAGARPRRVERVVRAGAAPRGRRPGRGADLRAARAPPHLRTGRRPAGAGPRHPARRG